MKSREMKICLNCNREIKGRGQKFCCQSCNGEYQNKDRIKKVEKPCLYCGSPTTNDKYCNYKCQQSYQRRLVFDKIENGDTTLPVKTYRKYLIYKHGEKCMECGWSEMNLHSQTIPIELEHIDGDSSNNSLNNLKLLCPNCHSLTPTYKGLNKGNGRYKRKQRYKDGQSY